MCLFSIYKRKKLVKKVRNFTFEIVQIDGEKEPGNFYKQLDCTVIVPFAMQLVLFWISPGEIVQFEAGKGKKNFAAVLHVFFLCLILQKLVFWLLLRTFFIIISGIFLANNSPSKQNAMNARPSRNKTVLYARSRVDGRVK